MKIETRDSAEFKCFTHLWFKESNKWYTLLQSDLVGQRGKALFRHIEFLASRPLQWMSSLDSCLTKPTHSLVWVVIMFFFKISLDTIVTLNNFDLVVYLFTIHWHFQFSLFCLNPILKENDTLVKHTLPVLLYQQFLVRFNHSLSLVWAISYKREQLISVLWYCRIRPPPTPPMNK